MTLGKHIYVTEFEWQHTNYRQLFQHDFIDQMTPEERTALDDLLVREAFRSAAIHDITVVRYDKVLWSQPPEPHLDTCYEAVVVMHGKDEPQIGEDLTYDLACELTKVPGEFASKQNPYDLARKAIEFLRQRGKLG